MKYPDLLKTTTATAGTGAITLAATAIQGYQTVAQAGLTTGDEFPYRIGDMGAAEWELGIGTMTGALTFSRAPATSSNSNALVNFSAGTKTVFSTAIGALLQKFFVSDDIDFSTAVPLTTAGEVYMPPQVVSAVLTFTAAASPVRGASVYVRLTADGVNVPVFDGFSEWGGSSGYDNRNGIVNSVWFFYDGDEAWYSIAQAIGAVPVDDIAPTASAAAVADATPTHVIITLSEMMDTDFTPDASSITISGHTVSSLSYASATTLDAVVTAAFVNGEAARTAAYTAPGSDWARDVAGNALASFTGLSVTNNVGAVAAALTFPTNTGLTTAGGNYTGTGTDPADYESHGVSVVKLTAGVDGYIECTNATNPRAIFGLTTVSTDNAWTTNPDYAMLIAGGVLYAYDAAGTLTNLGAPVNSAFYRINRTGTTVTLKVSTGGAYTTLHTFGVASSTDLYAHVYISQTATVTAPMQLGMA
jgi:hypothetical protein